MMENQSINSLGGIMGIYYYYLKNAINKLYNRLFQSVVPNFTWLDMCWQIWNQWLPIVQWMTRLTVPLIQIMIQNTIMHIHKLLYEYHGSLFAQ